MKHRTRTAVVAALLLAALPGPEPASASPAASAGRWGALRDDAFARLDAATEALARPGVAAAVRAAAALGDLDTSGLPEPVARPLAGLPASLAAPVGRLLGAIEAAGALASDRDRIADAGLLLATAIDEAIPVLAALPAAPGDGSAECDVFGQAPALCIGGTGANTYAQDFALVIDQGGDDLHANSAGGASPLQNELAAAVTIDLGGNDRYATAVPAASTVTVVQGAGSLGGVGMLVDVAGDDIYEATAGGSGSVTAQGTGTAGVGVLADLAGNDTYVARYRSPGAAVANDAVQALGYGALGGIGVVRDAGGDDTYLAHVNPVPTEVAGVIQAGSPSANAIGYGNLGGVGLVADGGGADSMTMDVQAGPIDPAESRPVAGTSTIAYGLGFGQTGGVGAILSTGTGPTAYSARVETATPRTTDTSSGNAATLLGLGAAQAGGVGMIQDAGGADSYRAEASSRAIRHQTITDGCGCAGAVPRTKADSAAAFAIGRSSGGRGVVRDVAGNDLYALTVTSYAETVARDERTEADAEASPPKAYAIAYGAAANGIAMGHLGGLGVVHDLAGNDRYESRATGESVSRASAALPELDAGAEAEANSIVVKSLGIGSGDAEGHGDLRDAAGDDAYVTVNTAPATAEPPTHADPGFAFTAVLASVESVGTASFADIGGTADTFVSVPLDTTCQGERFGQAWVDCGTPGVPVPGVGVGVNT